MQKVARDFEAKTVIITGAGSGLGRVFAIRFAARGATVVLAARKKDRLDATAELVEREGGRAIVAPLDIRQPLQVDEVIRSVKDLTGSIDVLVNNAAGNFLVRAEDLTPNGWNSVVNIVLNGTFYCSSAAGKVMLEQRRGKILSVVASYAWMGGPGTVHSAAAKAGVVAMSRTLAVEWAGRNVQVNCLCPGFVDTDQSREVLWPTVEGRTRILDRVPSGRFATPEEVVDAGIFLCGPSADYITGEVLTIDGGEWLNKGAFVLPDRHLT
jgi:NAD(P)-dependent dehydrogenase (short-subunit alcohol dehydrogenase family)